MPYHDLTCSYETIALLYKPENITQVVPEAYECEGCNSVFKSWSDLVRHISLAEAGRERRESA